MENPNITPEITQPRQKLRGALVAAALAMGVLPSLLLITSAQAQRQQEKRQQERREQQVERRTIVWSGQVDDVIDIYFKRGRMWTKTVRGKESDATARFITPLPERNVRVRLDNRTGRGTITLRQQPNRRNDFTAIVRVSDPKPDARRYQFELVW
jgi:hypothetical protein